MPEAVETKAEPKPVEEQAAEAFHELMIVWKKLRKNMNYGSYARVTAAILEFPLSDEKPKFKNEQELNAFKIGCTILDAKNVMIKKVIQDRRIKAALEQEQKEKENEVKSTT